MDPEKFELPDTLPTTVADLDALATLARDAFNAIMDGRKEAGEPLTDDDMTELTRLHEAAKTVEAAADTVHAEVAAREEAAAALAADLNGPAEGDEPSGDEPAGDAGAEGDEPSGEGDEPAGDAAGDAAPAEAPKGEPALVASGRTKAPARFSGAGQARRSVARNTPPAQGPTLAWSISPQVPSGAHKEGTTALAVAEAFDSVVSRKFPSSPIPGGGQLSNGVATLSRQLPSSLVASNTEEMDAIVERVCNEGNLKSAQGEGSLVAAGGWCAPSEIVYDFLGVPDAGDLFDLPELGIKRGGIRYPQEPDFGAIYDATGFYQTEAQAIANTPKDCFEVPCAGFLETRLDAIGLCITAGILQQAGYPEIVKRYVDGAMVAHQHKLAARSIQKVVDGSTPVTIPASSVIGATGALLNSVELAIEDIRSRHRLPSTTTLEVVLPTWAKVLIRADLAYRDQVGTDVITDAVIAQHFAVRKALVQYVSDWQTGATGQPGALVPITSLPSTIKFLVYPAGTWFRALNPVIELTAIYDNASLKQNRYTALFTEDGFAVGKRGVESRVYTVPVIPNGQVGERVDLGGARSIPA